MGFTFTGLPQPSRRGTTWAAKTVDIAKLLTSNGFSADASFSVVVGDTVMDSTNTYNIGNNGTNQGKLLAYNEGGLTAADRDANEPILYVNGPRTTPGSCDSKRPTIIGTSGLDVIHGTSGDDVIMTLGGNDIIYAGGDDSATGCESTTYVETLY